MVAQNKAGAVPVLTFRTKGTVVNRCFFPRFFFGEASSRVPDSGIPFSFFLEVFSY